MQNTLRFVSKLSCVALVLVLVAGMAFGQTTNGTIAGIVTDNTGAVITGATVTAAAAGGGETRTTTTGPNGEYRIEALKPGEYTVSVAATGFGKKNVTNVVVRTSVITSNNVQLAIASAQEIVSVEASPDQIQTESGELSKTIPLQDVKDLPYATLNPYQLATTLPGVTTPQGTSDFTNGVGFSVNGLRPRSNNFLIDGFDNNDNSIQGQAFQPGNVEAVQEVTVLTNSYAAEFGRGGGSVSNLTFRSGSNTFHGAAWEQYNGSALNSIAPENKRDLGMQREDCTPAQVAAAAAGGPPCVRGPGQLVSNIFGFRFGGPVIKNKLFFFGTSQWNRNYGAPQGAPTLFIPTANGIATLKNIAASDPAAAPQVNLLLQSMGPAVGGGSPTPVFVGVGAAGARPGCPAPCNVELGNFVRSDKAVGLNREITGRVDYTLEHDNIFVRYTDNQGSNAPDFLNNPGLPPLDTLQGGPTRLFGTTWSHTFNPNVLNEFRASVQQINFTFGPTAATAASPLASLPTIFFADNINTAIGGFGQGTFPQGRGHKTFQFQDALSWTKGTHTFKMGADLAILLVNDQIPFNFTGQVTVTGGGDCTVPNAGDCTDLSNFLDNFTGPTGSASKSFGNPRLNIPTSQQAYYFQDSWKIKPNLTVDYGVRYEYQPSDANNVLPFPAVNTNTFSTETFPTRHEVKPDRNNWGPRFGFSYTPHFAESIFGHDKTVLRGGAGVYYDTFFTNIADNSASGVPNTLGGANVADGSGRGISGLLTSVNGIAPVADPLNGITSVVDTLHNPKTYQWNLNIQRELPARTMFEVAYVGTRGTNLFINQELNPRVPNTTTFKTLGRIDPNFAGILVRTNGADSIYHGLQTSVTRNVGSLNVRGSYTWSRSIDNGSEVFTTTGQSSFWENYFNPNGDRGPSAFQHTHRAAISYVYQLPAPKFNKFLNATFGGWATSGFISFQSGSPDTISAGVDMNGDGRSTNDRPVLGNPSAALNYSTDCITKGSGCNTGVGVVSKTGTITALFSGAPVTADQVKYLLFPANSGVIGNVGRNSFYWPGRQDYNLSMIKRVKMPYREGHEVEFRVDFLNAFNHPNAGVGSLVDKLQDSHFQDVTNTVRGGRTINLWLKYQF